MTGPHNPTGAIVRTDFLLRFRRTTAIVALLAVAGGVYLIVPDIRTGRTLMQIEGRRVLYNSAAVALGTAMFCGLILTLVGYYLVSNSIRRDIVSRTGFLIASTPVSNSQYLTGKFAGNFLSLAVVATGCMLSAMVMFLIRGERPLEPVVFLATYLWILLPGIAFCSAMAVAFESLPLLSGRFGDVVYFFLWSTVLGFPIGLFENGIRWHWLGAFDVMGIIVIIGQIQDHYGTTTMSIGSSTFDAVKGPILYDGLQWGWEMIALRAASLIIPAGVLLIARLWFHRFNPARIKVSIRHARGSLLGRINTMLKPLTRMLGPLASLRLPGTRGASLANDVLAEYITTLLLSPLSVVALIVFAVLSAVLDVSSVQSGVLPAVVVAIILTLADAAPRDAASGMTDLLFTAPRLKAQYIPLKLMSALLITFSFTLIPAVRLFPAAPSAALSLCVGSCFIASGAVGLGILSGSQKPFIAIFLMLLYVALNARDSAAFDFAGFSGNATGGVQAGYSIASVALILAGYLKHRIIIREL